MKKLLIVISFIGLALTIIPSILVFLGTMSLSENKNLMMIGTLIWFFTAPFWMKSKTEEA